MNIPSIGSDLERAFDTYLAQLAPHLPPPACEVRFDSVRRWRFDRGWPDRKVAIELEGGAWQMGRHQRPQGFAADCAKYNAAALAGWAVLRFTASMLEDDPNSCIMLVVALITSRSVATKCVSGAHTFLGVSARRCGVAGCPEPPTGTHDYCKLHQTRYQRHGDPTIVLKRGRKPTRCRDD